MLPADATRSDVVSGNATPPPVLVATEVRETNYNELLQEASALLQNELNVQEFALSDPGLFSQAVLRYTPAPLYCPGGDKEHIRYLGKAHCLQILLRYSPTGPETYKKLTRELRKRGRRAKDESSVSALCTMNYANIARSTLTLDTNCLRYFDLLSISPSQIQTLAGGRRVWEDQYLNRIGAGKPDRAKRVSGRALDNQLRRIIAQSGADYALALTRLDPSDPSHVQAPKLLALPHLVSPGQEDEFWNYLTAAIDAFAWGSRNNDRLLLPSPEHLSCGSAASDLPLGGAT